MVRKSLTIQPKNLTRTTYWNIVRAKGIVEKHRYNGTDFIWVTIEAATEAELDAIEEKIRNRKDVLNVTA